MDDLRLHAVVARVVAWHNRHPLARRITAAQVNSVGYVALPYTAPGLPPPAAPAQAAPEPPAAPPPEPVEPIDPEPAIDSDDPGAIVIDVDPEPQAGSAADSQAMTPEAELPAAAPDLRPASALRARAAASEGDGSPHEPPPPAAVPASGAPRTLVCSEDFMLPIPVKKVLEWVHTHGVALPYEPGDGPVRQVPVDAALLPAGAGVAQLWVATAAIELGGQRHRLLLGGGAEPAVLGRRVWSRPRLLGALAAPCVLAVSLAWLLWPVAPASALPTLALAAEPAASAASAALAASAAAEPASAASAPEPGTGEVSAHSDAPSANAEAPRLPGLLDEAAKARARATVAALRAERQASAPAMPAAVSAAVSTAVPTLKPPPPAPAAQPAPPPAVLFGLSTRLLRTRAEAEQLQSAFQTLLGGAPGSTVRVEMLPVGEDWRVVCWPYERRADAERARALLQARGLRVELVDF